MANEGSGGSDPQSQKWKKILMVTIIGKGDNPTYIRSSQKDCHKNKIPILTACVARVIGCNNSLIWEMVGWAPITLATCAAKPPRQHNIACPASIHHLHGKRRNAEAGFEKMVEKTNAQIESGNINKVCSSENLPRNHIFSLFVSASCI